MEGCSKGGIQERMDLGKEDAGKEDAGKVGNMKGKVG